MTRVTTGLEAKICWLTRSSTALSCSGGQGLEVREVKAQVLGRHQRTGLGDMLAQDLLKGGVEQVGGGVVAAQETTALGVERGGHGSTDGQRALGNVGDVSIQAVVVLGIGNGQRNALGGKLAGVTLLAAHLGVERGAVEHDLDVLRPAAADSTDSPLRTMATTLAPSITSLS